MTARRIATYDLAEIQAKIRAGLYWVTYAARRGATNAGLTESDILACALALTGNDFYKSMEAKGIPGLWQDVYRPRFGQAELYVKLQLALGGDAVVISFKAR